MELCTVLAPNRLVRVCARELQLWNLDAHTLECTLTFDDRTHYSPDSACLLPGGRIAICWEDHDENPCSFFTVWNLYERRLEFRSSYRLGATQGFAVLDTTGDHITTLLWRYPDYERDCCFEVWQVRGDKPGLLVQRSFSGPTDEDDDDKSGSEDEMGMWVDDDATGETRWVADSEQTTVQCQQEEKIHQCRCRACYNDPWVVRARLVFGPRTPKLEKDNNAGDSLVSWKTVNSWRPTKKLWCARRCGTRQLTWQCARAGRVLGQLTVDDETFLVLDQISSSCSICAAVLLHTFRFDPIQRTLVEDRCEEVAQLYWSTSTPTVQMHQHYSNRLVFIECESAVAVWDNDTLTRLTEPQPPDTFGALLLELPSFDSDNNAFTVLASSCLFFLPPPLRSLIAAYLFREWNCQTGVLDKK